MNSWTVYETRLSKSLHLCPFYYGRSFVCQRSQRSSNANIKLPSAVDWGNHYRVTCLFYSCPVNTPICPDESLWYLEEWREFILAVYSNYISVAESSLTFVCDVYTFLSAVRSQIRLVEQRSNWDFSFDFLYHSAHLCLLAPDRLSICAVVVGIFQWLFL